MHSIHNKTKHYNVTVHFNGDFTGNAIVNWQPLRGEPIAIELAEVRVAMRSVLRGVDLPETVPFEVATRAVSMACDCWWSRCVINKLEDISVEGNTRL